MCSSPRKAAKSDQESDGQYEPYFITFSIYNFGSLLGLCQTLQLLFI